jgi:hypothetical protein
MTTDIKNEIENSIIAVIVNAYETGTLDRAHRAIGSAYRGTPEGLRIQNLKDAFRELSKFPHAADETKGYPGWGRVGDFGAREVINQVAFFVIRRAVASLDALVAQIQKSRQENGGRIPIAEIAGSKQNFVAQDVEMVMTLLDCKGVWVTPKLYQRLLGGLEEYHALMGFNPTVNRLCTRLTGLTRKFIQSHAQPQKPEPRVKTDAEQESPQAQVDNAVAESARASVDMETTDQQIADHRAQVLKEAVEKAERKAEAETIRIEAPRDPREETTRKVLNNRDAAVLSASIPKPENFGESHE